MCPPSMSPLLPPSSRPSTSAAVPMPVPSAANHDPVIKANQLVASQSPVRFKIDAPTHIARYFLTNDHTHTY